jgi:hypothetical protein
MQKFKTLNETNMKKIISFCVWGNNPKYCIGAIKNAILAKQIYPDWICRYHCDKSVPKDIIEKLKNLDNVEILMFENCNNWKFTTSRLFSLDDPNIEYIIFRDTDSRLSYREKAAVDEWILSGKSAHIMKDHPWHGSFPILAGMFGLKCGIVKNIADKLNNFQINEQYHYDQIFINNEIYPFIKNDCVIHDEIFEKKPFPTKRVNYEFVGEVFDENENTVHEHTEVLKKYYQ